MRKKPDARPGTAERSVTNRILFTVKNIERLPIPASGRKTIYDTHTSANGLALRLDSNGKRIYFWFRSVRGKPVFRSLGTFEATPIDEARGRARKLTAKLEKWRENDYAGANPFEESEDAPTFDSLVEQYIAKRIQLHAARKERAVANYKWINKTYLNDWKDRKVSTITDADIRTLHRKITKENGPVTADRVYQFIRACFYWGVGKEKVITANPAAKAVQMNGCKPRRRFLDGEELAKLFAAMQQSEESNPDLSDFIKIALWTGARRGDIFSARWKDVKLADNQWHIPSSKGDTQYTVPLTPEAIEVLTARKERHKESKSDSPYVFPSDGASGHIIDLKRGWKRLLKLAGIQDLRIHDLRRTYGSWQACNGTSLAIIGKSLGHKPGSPATAIYGQLDLTPVLASTSAATAAMAAATKGKPQLTAGK
ncbi:MAG TPA: tyrosine-type recombinase/integrase [Candidatus Acidoferrum sp.]|nr:tyrosine-type recombinase/integrase [Candidatus Acidoferrum sp.]